MKFVLHTCINKKTMEENIETMKKKNWKISNVKLIADIPGEPVTKEQVLERFETEKFGVDFIIEYGDPKDLRGIHL